MTRAMYLQASVLNPMLMLRGNASRSGNVPDGPGRRRPQRFGGKGGGIVSRTLGLAA
jgi:hypothetical protein